MKVEAHKLKVKSCKCKHICITWRAIIVVAFETSAAWPRRSSESRQQRPAPEGSISSEISSRLEARGADLIIKSARGWVNLSVAASPQKGNPQTEKAGAAQSTREGSATARRRVYNYTWRENQNKPPRLILGYQHFGEKYPEIS